MHTFALAYFPHLHGIGRSSDKEIVIMFDFITSSPSSPSCCSCTQVDQFSNFLQMENVTKHMIADMHILFVAKYLLMSGEVFQDPIS